MDPFFQCSWFGSLNFCSFLFGFSWEASMKFSLLCAHGGGFERDDLQVPWTIPWPCAGCKINNAAGNHSVCTIYTQYKSFSGFLHHLKSIPYFFRNEDWIICNYSIMSCWNGVHGKGLHNSFLLEKLQSFFPWVCCWLCHLGADQWDLGVLSEFPFKWMWAGRARGICWKWDKHCPAGSGVLPSPGVCQENCKKAQGDYLKIDCKLAGRQSSHCCRGVYDLFMFT